MINFYVFSHFIRKSETIETFFYIFFGMSYRLLFYLHQMLDVPYAQFSIHAAQPTYIRSERIESEGNENKLMETFVRKNKFKFR